MLKNENMYQIKKIIFQKIKLLTHSFKNTPEDFHWILKKSTIVYLFFFQLVTFSANHCVHSFHEWKMGLRYQVGIIHRECTYVDRLCTPCHSNVISTSNLHKVLIN